MNSNLIDGRLNELILRDFIGALFLIPFSFGYKNNLFKTLFYISPFLIPSRGLI